MIKLDGKKYSQEILQEIKKFYETEPTEKRLAVVRAGDDYASKVYCEMKQKKANEIGLRCDVLEVKNPNENYLAYFIKQLVNDDKYVGIMVQHPLPKEINEQRIFDLIPEEKDVDGLSSLTQGKIVTKSNIFAPATAVGIIDLLKHYDIDLVAKNVLVIGRSTIVGKPLANMFTNEDSTVTLAHSKTNDLQSKIDNADIIVSAVGIPNFITAEQINHKQILVDAGYKDGFGDIDKSAYEKSSYYTPVPNGVGPMTIASLMKNTQKAVIFDRINSDNGYYME